jgi:hypothetical protein
MPREHDVGRTGQRVSPFFISAGFSDCNCVGGLRTPTPAQPQPLPRPSRTLTVRVRGRKRARSVGRELGRDARTVSAPSQGRVIKIRTHPSYAVVSRAATA